jgi:hypothetical protein
MQIASSGYPTYMIPSNFFKRGVAHVHPMARDRDGFATPFLYYSFIRYFTPLYPDAIQA